MQNSKCPTCGGDLNPDAACPGCGHANGVAKTHWGKPQAPPEVVTWVIEPVPPELSEDFRRTFNEAAFVAEMDETLRTGGADIDALIARIERKAHGGN